MVRYGMTWLLECLSPTFGSKWDTQFCNFPCCVLFHRFALLASVRFQNVFCSKSHLNCRLQRDFKSIFPNIGADEHSAVPPNFHWSRSKTQVSLHLSVSSRIHSQSVTLFPIIGLWCLRLGQQRTRWWRDHLPNFAPVPRLFSVTCITQSRVRLVCLFVAIRVHACRKQKTYSDL
jgi:hypothetical protein